MAGYYFVSEIGPRACTINSPIALYFLHPLSHQLDRCRRQDSRSRGGHCKPSAAPCLQDIDFGLFLHIHWRSKLSCGVSVQFTDTIFPGRTNVIAYNVLPLACAINSSIVLYLFHPSSQRAGPSATYRAYKPSSVSRTSFTVRSPHQTYRNSPPAVYIVKEYRVSPSAIGTFSWVTAPEGMNITSPRRNSKITFGSWRIMWPPVRWLNGPSAPMGHVPYIRFQKSRWAMHTVSGPIFIVKAQNGESGNTARKRQLMAMSSS
jgi:hypothetical protein